MTFHDEYVARCAEKSDIYKHLPFIYETVLRFPGARVLELGVRGGNSTAALLAAVEAVGGHLWSVDIAKPKVPTWWYDAPFWTVTVCDDLEYVAPPDLDVLFIDTSHTYDHTLCELRRFSARVTLLHDTELEALVEAPDPIDHPQPPFPVAAALNTYCAETGRRWVNRTGCYGLGVIEDGD